MRKVVGAFVLGMGVCTSVTAKSAVDSLYEKPFQALSPTEVVVLGQDRNL